jgi:hypothetical protein
VRRPRREDQDEAVEGAAAPVAVVTDERGGD